MGVGVLVGVGVRVGVLVGVGVGPGVGVRVSVGVGGGSHEHPAAGDEGQGGAGHVRGQGKPIAPVQPVLGDVVDVIGNEGDVQQDFQPVPTGIAIPERIVVDVRIPIPRLDALALLGDERVGLGEAHQGRVVVARPVVVQPGGVKLLASVGVLHHRRAPTPPCPGVAHGS